MDIKRLKNDISKYGGIDKLLAELKKRGIVMSRASYFRKVKGNTEFTRCEMLGIAEELKMNDRDMFEIFFKQEVSKKTQRKGRN